MIKDFLSGLKVYAQNNKKIVLIVGIVWLVITLFIGVVIGISSREGVITLSPEEENNKAINIIKNDKDKIDNGLILTPEKNLSIKQIELSKDYAVKSKIIKK